MQKLRIPWKTGEGDRKTANANCKQFLDRIFCLQISGPLLEGCSQSGCKLTRFQWQCPLLNWVISPRRIGTYFLSRCIRLGNYEILKFWGTVNSIFFGITGCGWGGGCYVTIKTVDQHDDLSSSDLFCFPAAKICSCPVVQTLVGWST